MYTPKVTDDLSPKGQNMPKKVTLNPPKLTIKPKVTKIIERLKVGKVAAVKKSPIKSPRAPDGVAAKVKDFEKMMKKIENTPSKKTKRKGIKFTPSKTSRITPIRLKYMNKNPKKHLTPQTPQNMGEKIPKKQQSSKKYPGRNNEKSATSVPPPKNENPVGKTNLHANRLMPKKMPMQREALPNIERTLNTLHTTANAPSPRMEKPKKPKKPVMKTKCDKKWTEIEKNKDGKLILINVIDFGIVRTSRRKKIKRGEIRREKKTNFEKNKGENEEKIVKFEKKVDLLNENDDQNHEKREKRKKKNGKMKEIGEMQRGGSGEKKERICIEDKKSLKTSARMQDMDIPSLASGTLYNLNNQMTKPFLEDASQQIQVSSNSTNTNLTTGRTEYERLGPANRNEIWRNSCNDKEHLDILTEMNEGEEMIKPSEDDF